MMYTREELISVCEAATVPVSEWRDRDTSSAQRQMGEAWVLLKAGAEISFSDNPATDNRTIWVRLRFPGFAHFDCDGSEETALFYLPTPESLANANGQDWY